ncbi:MAG: PAS domain-containing protein [Bacteroidetes bacterium]|nr:PAS domain-containing protein [Bacteroidota bacterium]
MSVLDKHTTTQLLNHFTEGVVLLNTKHQIIFCSDFFISLIGYSNEQLTNKSVDDLFFDKKKEMVALFEAANYSESIVFYTPLQKKDGSQFVARVRLIKNTNTDEEGRFILYIKDNSPYQRIRKDLLKKHLQLNIFLNREKLEMENWMMRFMKFSKWHLVQ